MEYFEMEIVISEVLEEPAVQQAITEKVQAKLKEAERRLAGKLAQLRVLESENFVLKLEIAGLERLNLQLKEELKKSRRQLQKVKKEHFLGQSDDPKNDAYPGRWTGREFVKGELATRASISSSVSTAKGQHCQDFLKNGWVCICGLKLFTKDNLRRHIKYHRTGQNFSCSRCPARCVSGSDMKRHMRSVHKVEPASWMRYGCRQCGAFFPSSDKLLFHKKSVHKQNVAVTSIKQQHQNPEPNTSCLPKNLTKKSGEPVNFQTLRKYRRHSICTSCKQK